MFNLFNFDLDSERLKDFFKDHILKFMVGFIVVMFCFIGFMVFNILKPKEQIKSNYISNSDVVTHQKDLLKTAHYKKTIGFDFVQILFQFNKKDLSTVQKMTEQGQIKDTIKKDFDVHDTQSIKTIKLISSTKQEQVLTSESSVQEETTISPKAESIQEVYEVETSSAKFMTIVLIQNEKVERYDYIEVVH